MPKINKVMFTLNEAAVRKVILSALLKRGPDGNYSSLNLGDMVHLVRSARLPGIFCSEDKVLKIMWKSVAVQLLGAAEPERRDKGSGPYVYITFYPGPASISELRFMLVELGKDEKKWD